MARRWRPEHARAKSFGGKSTAATRGPTSSRSRQQKNARIYLYGNVVLGSHFGHGDRWILFPEAVDDTQRLRRRCDNNAGVRFSVAAAVVAVAIAALEVADRERVSRVDAVPCGAQAVVGAR